jgi:hypothetical protein
MQFGWLRFYSQTKELANSLLQNSGCGGRFVHKFLIVGQLEFHN